MATVTTVDEKDWDEDGVVRAKIYNNYSMRPSWIWSDKITNERVARVGYNDFISNKGKWNNCFSKFSNRVLPPIFISTILQSVWKEKLAHYFPYDVKLGLLADSRRFLANQKARNAIVGAENLLIRNIHSLYFWLSSVFSLVHSWDNTRSHARTTQISDFPNEKRFLIIFSGYKH